jgi:hypothetical protein
VNFKLVDETDYGSIGPVNFCVVAPTKKIRKSVLHNVVYRIPSGVLSSLFIKCDKMRMKS